MADLTKKEAGYCLTLLDETPKGNLFYRINFSDQKIGGQGEITDLILELAKALTYRLLPANLFSRKYVKQIVVPVVKNTSWKVPDAVVLFKFDREAIEEAAS